MIRSETLVVPAQGRDDGYPLLRSPAEIPLMVI